MDDTIPAELEIPAVALAAFRAVWHEVGDLPYGPGRLGDFERADGTFDRDSMRAADAEASRLNDDVIRRAVAAARSAHEPSRDHAAADQAHRDDLARDVAQMWGPAVSLVDAATGTIRKDWPGLAEALDRLADAFDR
jgi:hypothetical protein